MKPVQNYKAKSEFTKALRQLVIILKVFAGKIYNFTENNSQQETQK